MSMSSENYVAANNAHVHVINRERREKKNILSIFLSSKHL